MAYPTTLRRMIIAYNGVEGPEYFQADASLMKPGMICAWADADEVKRCITTDFPIGVVGCDADHDLSTVYSIGERVPVWMLGCGVDLYVLCGDTSTQTIERGEILELADATSFSGYGKRKEAWASGTTTHTHATTGERGWGNSFWIGRILEGGTLTSSVTHYIPIKLSI